MKWVAIGTLLCLWGLVVYLSRVEEEITQMEYEWWQRKLRWKRERMAKYK